MNEILNGMTLKIVKVCKDKHEGYIAYEVAECPLCKVLREIEDLKAEILENTIKENDLNEQM